MYEVSPWALCWDDENYYLIAFDENEQKIKHYRVDKMKNITMTDDLRNGRNHFEHFDMAEYMKRSFGMFGGDSELVKLRVKNELVGVIIDRFGKDVTLFPDDEEHFLVHVKVNVSNQFFAWVFGLGTGIEILGPEKVREQMAVYIEKVGKMYQ
ncbi:MAG: WYL domain-containing protein [Lachnospiraceae bacterium]|nr:WYL domain-containing protein [Lachnospiraceae bacterium]